MCYTVLTGGFMDNIKIIEKLHQIFTPIAIKLETQVKEDNNKELRQEMYAKWRKIVELMLNWYEANRVEIKEMKKQRDGTDFEDVVKLKPLPNKFEVKELEEYEKDFLPILHDFASNRTKVAKARDILEGFIYKFRRGWFEKVGKLPENAPTNSFDADSYR
jgi:ATP-dependent helicase/DNAse subunit B